MSLRLIYPDAVYHVMTRGNNRSTVFHDKADYEKYLSILETTQANHPFNLFSYCLMPNHVHLLLQPKDKTTVSKILQAQNRGYTLYYNKRYHRLGHLWQGRFKALVVEEELYLLRLMAYIELNSLRAHLVKNPSDYPWSSFSHNALGIQNPLIHPHELYLTLGKADLGRQKAYQKVLEDCSRSDTEAHLFLQGEIIGSQDFKTKFQEQQLEMLRLRNRNQNKGRPQKVLV